MDEKLKERLTDIFESEEVMRKISMSKSLEEMQAIFAENCVDFSLEEVKVFVDFMNTVANGELSEDDLDRVAGGVAVAEIEVLKWVWEGVKKVARPCWEAGRWFARQGW